MRATLGAGRRAVAVVVVVVVVGVASAAQPATVIAAVVVAAAATAADAHLARRSLPAGRAHDAPQLAVPLNHATLRLHLRRQLRVLPFLGNAVAALADVRVLAQALDVAHRELEGRGRRHLVILLVTHQRPESRHPRRELDTRGCERERDLLQRPEVVFAGSNRRRRRMPRLWLLYARLRRLLRRRPARDGELLLCARLRLRRRRARLLLNARLRLRRRPEPPQSEEPAHERTPAPRGRASDGRATQRAT
mmetsp:Transcript_7676/g.18227  ORF Transcript_7676/g.18227 Transcript_7676/m.18227 type:complete len:250 (+) Transcript_7676:138-887(+)